MHRLFFSVVAALTIICHDVGENDTKVWEMLERRQESGHVDCEEEL